MNPPRLFSSLVLIGLALVVGGCMSSRKKDEPLAVVRFMLEATGRDVSGTVQLPRSGTIIPLEAKSYFTEFDINSCSVVDNEFGKSLVFELTSQAGRDLYRVTATNQGKRLVTILNGQAIGARRIEGPLDQGYIVTYVEIDDSHLAETARLITNSSREARKDLEKNR